MHVSGICVLIYSDNVEERFPVKCEICGQRFVARNRLKHHMKSHLGILSVLHRFDIASVFKQ